MSIKRRFRWHHFQLILAALLQLLIVLAPLSYSVNWEQNSTAILHPAYIVGETYEPELRDSTVETTYFFQRIELALLSFWVLALSGFLFWMAFGKMDLDRRKDYLGKSMGGFALQIIIAYFVSLSVSWHVGEVTGDSTITTTQPEFLLFMFPMVFAYLAYLNLKKLSVQTTQDQRPA